MPVRHVQRTSVPEAASRTYDRRACAFWHVNSDALPLRFDDPDAKHVRGITANDADPSTTAPDEQTRVFSARCSNLGIVVECDQSVEIEVWQKAEGLTESADPEWVCLRRGITVAPATSAMVVVPVHWSPSFVRVVSGADVAHPVNLFVAVC